jgi:shikimate dehydrogenase
VIHNAAFSATGLDWVYEAFDIGPDEVAGFVERAAADGFGGLNVTMPDKEAAAAAVDRRTPDAEALGAVNTVIFDDRATTVGDNTDGPGFVDALAAEVPELRLAGCRAGGVGAGGAARAVILALGRAGVASIVVVNRTRTRADAAVALAPEVARVGEAADLAGLDLVVDATPAGMGGATDLPFDAELLGRGQVVCDLVYWPVETPLLREATARGARAINGLGMLVHQAARSFERWTGVDAPIDAMTAAVRAELQRRG